MNLYVGNLAYTTRDDDLHAEFSKFGEVTSARVIMDRMTDRSKGFGFVEMADDSAGREAIEALDGRSFQGRDIKVNEARPRDDRGGGGGGGGGFRPRY